MGKRQSAKRRQLSCTPKQRRFAREYLVDHNATAAATRVSYNPKYAAHLMAKPHVRAEIERLEGQQSERLEISADRVMRELALVAFLDPLEGDVERLAQMPEQVRRALAGHEVQRLAGTKDGTLTKIKYASKLQALDTIAKIKGMYRESSGDAFEDLVERILTGRRQAAREIEEARVSEETGA